MLFFDFFKCYPHTSRGNATSYFTSLHLPLFFKFDPCPSRANAIPHFHLPVPLLISQNGVHPSHPSGVLYPFSSPSFLKNVTHPIHQGRQSCLPGKGHCSPRGSHLQYIPSVGRNATHHYTFPFYLPFLISHTSHPSGDGNPFAYLEKATVVQEARIFNATPIQPRRCCFVLAKILYLIYQGEVFGTKEATSAFFAMTRLFQHKDVCGFLLLARSFCVKKWGVSQFVK